MVSTTRMRKQIRTKLNIGSTCEGEKRHPTSGLIAWAVVSGKNSEVIRTH